MPTRRAGDESRFAGVLLVGGSSRRFGSPKALARLDRETLAERAWRVLGEACTERVAVGKAADGLELPFPLVDDGTPVRAPLAGLVAGLRVVAADVAVFLPVDCPLVTADVLRGLAAACRDAAIADGPLPAAFRRTALPHLEACLVAGRLALHDALRGLDTATVDVDPGMLVNVNSRDELARLAVYGSGDQEPR